MNIESTKKNYKVCIYTKVLFQSMKLNNNITSRGTVWKKWLWTHFYLFTILVQNIIHAKFLVQNSQVQELEKTANNSTKMYETNSQSKKRISVWILHLSTLNQPECNNISLVTRLVCTPCNSIQVLFLKNTLYVHIFIYSYCATVKNTLQLYIAPYTLYKLQLKYIILYFTSKMCPKCILRRYLGTF